MKKFDYRRGIFFAVALAVLAAAAAVPGYRWLRRVQQKAELTAAVSAAFSELNTRFAGSPLGLAAEYMEPNCRYTAKGFLTREAETEQPAVYDLSIQTDGLTHQLFAQGNAQAGGKALDLSVYLGPEALAASSEELAKGRFYGISYDTFSEDIRGIPLLSMIVGDELLDKWNASLQNIRANTNRSYQLPEIPKMDPAQTQRLLLGMLAMPCQVEACTLTVNNVPAACQRFSYQISGAQAASAWTDIVGDSPGSENTEVSAVFYLSGKNILKMELACTADGNAVRYALELGEAPSSGPLKLTAGQKMNGRERQFEAELSAVPSARGNTNTCRIRWNQDGIAKTSQFSYRWAPDTGELILGPNGAETEIAMRLSKTEEGLRIVSDDFSQLVRLITRDRSEKPPKNISCDIVLKTGSSIQPPEYKSPDQWSLEDFYALVLGVGSLFGFGL